MTDQAAAAVPTKKWLPLPPTLWTVRLGRHHVRDCIRGLNGRYDEATAMLLASELLTNALVHTDGGFRLSVRETAGTLRVEVDDYSPTDLPMRLASEVEALDASGRGLMLVAELASAWGVDQVDASDDTPASKVVWFEIAAISDAQVGLRAPRDAPSTDA